MSSRPRKPVKEGASPDASISAVSEKTSSSLISSPDEGRNQRVTRRTGIQAATPGKVPLEAGTVFEDVDAFFQSSRRPALTSQNDEQQKRDRDNKTTSSEREGLQNSDDDTSKGNTSSSNRSRSDRQQQRQQEKEANSRQYQQHVAKLTEPTFDIFKSNVTADDKRSEETTAESAKSSKYMQRIIMTQKNRNSSHLNIPQSPSELSHATTIPPTPASKASATKSILRSATGGKGQVEATTTKDGTPFSAASDKSVRWNVDEDNSDELPEDESESQLQGSGKKEMNIGSQGETDDLYPNDDDDDDDDNISGLFVTRPSPSATLNTSLDRAAALLPVPNSEMKRKATGSSFDDDHSPTPLEDSMAEMLNNTDDTIHDNEDKEGGGSSHGRNADATGSDLASGEEPDDYGNQHHDDDDDDEDDEKEGEAFAFASHDSNDPDDENMDRRTKQSKVPATDKDTRPAKRRGRNPKTKASPVSPETPRNVSENKKKQKKSKKQSAKYATPPGFKGHAVGNRDYETVPVTDYQDDEEEEDDDGNVRRSKRARFKPLEYWRNEKLVYEAHHETGVLGEALGHMPVVTGVVRALPTPHARRKANRKAESDTESDEDDEKIKKKGKKKKASNSSESDEYDSSNLRKVRILFNTEWTYSYARNTC
jgi:hypothetical protein